MVNYEVDRKKRKITLLKGIRETLGNLTVFQDCIVYLVCLYGVGYRQHGVWLSQWG